MGGRHYRSVRHHRSPRHRGHDQVLTDPSSVGRVVGLAVLAVAILCQTLIAAGMGRSGPSGAQLTTLTGPLLARSRPVPVAIRIPRLGVDSSLVPIVVDDTGALQPPPSPDVAGWYTASAVPGDLGPTIIAGHVDSRTGPGVFNGLDSLKPGDKVEVVRSDGRTVTFWVLSTDTFDKDRFPTESVYGPAPVPELRLITCGGRFDHNAGRYLANVIVHAGPRSDPTSSWRPP